ncbi:MAG TPA: hypothetical protein VGX76_14435, partial [Pirellulales bacterium]|nr:hypothetical protein [Pirellulales bacterium]
MHMLPHLEAAGRPGLADASGPQSIVRLPNLATRRPATSAVPVDGAALVPQSAKSNTQVAAQPLHPASDPATKQEPAPSKYPALVRDWLGRISWNSVADRLKALHAFVMRPKIWLACVACLSLVALVTLVPRKA